ncbi:putative ribosome biogenesis GTPase RsgA [Jannaschia pagri]|uniref:Small ribosomal subunit biogenesis GTPase RsgA n=1 Tax=Jannaschia pagri TaxID=2829797 RepID=A0ABQ4NQT4_9RHOB|nr:MULTISPECIES: ribosome small subunit-dependent GTPase A [unclassified Jannaschia]GIT92871.1 putative ribosome biogenesis GTPase RsgA [Jannaschia sp. AI_61]GIT96706.1 putative ribosome biogenesis GTPase RsgA [Jannaschia sp. AI_62]
MVRDYSQFMPNVKPPAPTPLAALGWQTHFAMQVTPEALSQAPPIRVTRVDRVEVHVTDGETTWTLPPIADVAVGDWVLPTQPPTILDRKSLLKRRAAGHERSVQLIAANIDTVFVVTSCNADFNVARLERFLALTFDAGADPVIVLTKADQSDPAPYLAQAQGLSKEVACVAVNAKDSAAAEAFAPWCRPGCTVAFLGTSGVGKSTLLNALLGEDLAATGTIREDDARGRHTTTRRELHVTPGGFAVLDTPGMRELQLTDVAAGISEVFSDITDLAGACKFNDCAHEAEPGCAVRAAIAAGQIDPARLERWRKLAAEDAFNSADLAERRRKDKAFGKTVKQALRSKRR